MATPDMEWNADSVPTPGEVGATGTFNHRINSADEIVCYDITPCGVTPPYMNPARTAMHIHRAAAHRVPEPRGRGRRQVAQRGLHAGPVHYRDHGGGAGTGFTLDQIEADPAAFFTDTHTATFTAGAVRGQLTAVPMGGVETGAGGNLGRRLGAHRPRGGVARRLGRCRCRAAACPEPIASGASAGPRAPAPRSAERAASWPGSALSPC